MRGALSAAASRLCGLWKLLMIKRVTRKKQRMGKRLSNGIRRHPCGDEGEVKCKKSRCPQKSSRSQVRPPVRMKSSADPPTTVTVQLLLAEGRALYSRGVDVVLLGRSEVHKQSTRGRPRAACRARRRVDWPLLAPAFRTHSSFSLSWLRDSSPQSRLSWARLRRRQMPLIGKPREPKRPC